MPATYRVANCSTSRPIKDKREAILISLRPLLNLRRGAITSKNSSTKAYSTRAKPLLLARSLRASSSQNRLRHARAASLRLSLKRARSNASQTRRHALFLRLMRPRLESQRGMLHDHCINHSLRPPLKTQHLRFSCVTSEGLVSLEPAHGSPNLRYCSRS